MRIASQDGIRIRNAKVEGSISLRSTTSASQQLSGLVRRNLPIQKTQNCSCGRFAELYDLVRDNHQVVDLRRTVVRGHVACFVA